MSDRQIERRQLLQLASATLLAANFRLPAETCTNAAHGAPADAIPYTPQFFTPDEVALLDRVMEAILPADEHSPGAHEAQTALYADLVVASSPDDVKQDWRGGLRSLAAELRTGSLTEWLNRASAQERDPQSPLDVFFLKLKQTTVEGYYTSRIGIHQELRYQGNAYVKEFKGCNHEEHQTAASDLRSHYPDGPATLGHQQTT